MADYSPEWVRDHYDRYGLQEWDRWERDEVQQVKLRLHLAYLERYLRADDRVLEMGAGAGRFTREIARITGRVVVADISPVQLELNRQKAQEHGFAPAVESWVECDMCDLTPHFGDGRFDAVVCYGGPLSYVFERRDDAARELLRVVRPGGRLLVSVMSLWGSVHQFLHGVLELAAEDNRRIIASGDLTPELAPGSQRCHMFRSGELRECLERAGAIVEVVSASNCLSDAYEGRLEEFRRRPERWAHLLEMELEAAREPGCRDMGTHIIAVCRRPQ